jgi:hypothetical protein
LFEQLFGHPEIRIVQLTSETLAFAMTGACSRVDFVPLPIEPDGNPSVVGLDGSWVYFLPGFTQITFLSGAVDSFQVTHQFEQKSKTVAAGAAGFQNVLQLLLGVK